MVLSGVVVTASVIVVVATKVGEGAVSQLELATCLIHWLVD